MSGGVDSDYEQMLLRSWEHPLEQVNNVISVERKVNMKGALVVHSRANHEYHMKRFRRCLYCDKGIPIQDEKERERP